MITTMTLNTYIMKTYFIILLLLIRGFNKDTMLILIRCTRKKDKS